MARTAGLAIACLGLALAGAALADGGIDLRAALLAIPQTAKLGGDTTRPVSNRDAYSFLVANARKERQRPFSFGNRLFNTNWTEAPGSVKSFDGLGPMYNRVSCSGCHTRDGRGSPPESADARLESLLIRVSVPGNDEHGGPKPVPGYGDQISEYGNPGIPAEARTHVSYTEQPGALGDGTAYSLRSPRFDFTGMGYGAPAVDMMISPRTAPAIFGLGLLQVVPEETLLALGDADDTDGDGVSGHVNRVWDGKAKREAIGRFGWKAGQPTLELQNAGAALGDMGISTSIHRGPNCAEGQAACAAAQSGGAPELSDEFLARLTLYTMTLAVPAQRDAGNGVVKQGAVLFRSAGCAACHMPTLKTGGSPDVPELAGQTIHPFTDLLLHDMGPDLADNRPEYLATGSEWRTPPLWGLGLMRTVNGHQNLMHDGRARGAEEAILWHGGEAAASQGAFKALSAADRAALITFLNSL